MRELLDASADDSPEGESNRKLIGLHQIEIARRVGRGSDAKPSDATSAAIALFAYDMGRPREGGTVAVPKNTSGSALEILSRAIKERVLAGEVGEGELHGLLSTLQSAERDKALIFIKAMGPRLHTLKSEQVDAMMKEYEADPQKFLGMNPPTTDGEGDPQP